MNFKTETKTLSNAVNMALNFSQKAAFLITTGMVYIKTNEDSVTLRATNNKTNFCATIPAEIREGGEALVSTEKLAGVLSNITSENITLCSDDNKKFYIKPEEARKTKICLSYRNPKDFPEEKSCPDNMYVTIPGKAVADALLHVAFATAKPSASLGPRAPFAGINVEQEKKDGKIYLTFVATDGRALATEKIEIANEIPLLTKAVLPIELVNKTLPILKKVNPEVAFFDGYLFLRYETIRVNGFLLDSAYPNWRRVLPQTDEFNTVNVSDIELAETLGLTSVLVEEKSHKTSLTFTSNSLTVKAYSPELGEAEQEIETTSTFTENEERVVDFSAQLLNPIIANLKNSEIIIKIFKESYMPFIFLSDSMPNLIYCIMPMVNA